ncbi:hypothetical protein V8Z74_14910 [Comamonas sp. w2-DMI]|uniref:hypothetical protein n=1 Tax=Comamonas sp. w2-DMI TaxID=3126391 RepID=UPI0032E4F6DA
MTITSEKICLVLRSRGLPSAQAHEYRPLLNGLSVEDLCLVEMHLHAVARSEDDELSQQFFGDLTQLAKGYKVSSRDLLLSKICHSVERNTVAQVSQIEANDFSVVPQGMTPSRSTMRTAQEQEVFRKKHYVYGQKCAFMFELDWLKAKPGHGKQKRTLTVEAALQIAQRSYDWEGRISFQLTLLELPQFTAVLLGKLAPEQVWAVGNHGRTRDKHLRAKEQAASIFLKLEQGGKRWPIRVSQEHRYQILSLALEALKYNDEHLDLATIRQLCAASLPRSL